MYPQNPPMQSSFSPRLSPRQQIVMPYFNNSKVYIVKISTSYIKCILYLWEYSSLWQSGNSIVFYQWLVLTNGMGGLFFWSPNRCFPSLKKKQRKVIFSFFWLKDLCESLLLCCDQEKWTWGPKSTCWNWQSENMKESCFLWMLLIFGLTNIGISLSLDFLIYEQ